MSKNHVSSQKTGKKGHTTIIDAVIPVVRFLEKYSLVTKFKPGMINQGRSKNLRIVIKPNNGGFLLVVYGNSTFQEIVVSTGATTKFKQLIKKDLGGEFNIQVRE